MNEYIVLAPSLSFFHILLGLFAVTCVISLISHFFTSLGKRASCSSGKHNKDDDGDGDGDEENFDEFLKGMFP